MTTKKATSRRQKVVPPQDQPARPMNITIEQRLELTRLASFEIGSLVTGLHREALVLREFDAEVDILLALIDRLRGLATALQAVSQPQEDDSHKPDEIMRRIRHSERVFGLEEMEIQP